MFKAFREAKARMQIAPMLEQSKYYLLETGIRMSSADWDDPYLYGYHNGGTQALLVVGSSGRLAHESITRVQAWGWSELTGLPERLYVTRSISFIDANDQEWKSGFNKGLMWSSLLTGHVNRDAPDVQQTIEQGRALGALARQAVVGNDLGGELHDAAALAYQRDWLCYIQAKKRQAA